MATAVFGDFWRVTSVAPRIVNDVSYVTRINLERHFLLAGTLFGDFGGWVLLLLALEMTFHV